MPELCHDKEKFIPDDSRFKSLKVIIGGQKIYPVFTKNDLLNLCSIASQDWKESWNDTHLQ